MEALLVGLQVTGRQAEMLLKALALLSRLSPGAIIKEASRRIKVR